MRIVFVPGFSQPASSWRPVLTAPALDAMRPGVETVAVDVPDGLGFDATAAAIGDAAGRAIYVGYSMGGRLALALALDRPELVTGLVLVSASAGIADPDERAARADADAELAEHVRAVGVEAFLDRWLAQAIFATLPRDRTGREERVEANTPERLAHQLTVLGQGAMVPRWDRLGALVMPVLLVTGTLDATYRSIAAEMASRIPDARHRELTGGHALPAEAPDALAVQVAAFAHEPGSAAGRTE